MATLGTHLWPGSGNNQPRQLTWLQHAGFYIPKEWLTGSRGKLVLQLLCNLCSPAGDGNPTGVMEGVTFVMARCAINSILDANFRTPKSTAGTHI